MIVLMLTVVILAPGGESFSVEFFVTAKGHYRGVSLTHVKLITVLFMIST